MPSLALPLLGIAACSALDHATGMSVETYGKDWQEYGGSDPTGYFDPKTIGTSGGSLFTGGVIDRGTYGNALKLGGGLQDSGKFNTPVPVQNFFAGGTAENGTHVYSPGWVDPGFTDHHITFEVDNGYVTGTGIQFNRGAQ